MRIENWDLFVIWCLRFEILLLRSLFLNIEPAHKLKIDQNKLQNCRSNILNLVNVL
ncbi:hypothetical protein D1AOALGA4SA_7350 [Olavius algarvensis Delta 1 endosymbiont]|nr:hypothetical protein D1AOALGA4SA_7350 [Olavius algarvensis Delta 1 endosymbiont]